MSRLLFLRSYLAIIILIVGVGWGLDKLLLHLAAEENLQSDRRGINTAFLYLESVLKQQEKGVEESWDKHRTKIQVALGYPIALYRVSDFSGERKVIQTLKAGEIMTVATEQKALIYYRKSQNSDYIFALGPIKNKAERQSTDAIIIAIYYLLVATAIYLWLLPFSRDLCELRKATKKFGNENFSARVNVGKNSSIAPVATAFNSMAQRIDDLITAHQDLTHAVSHELKTPLSRFKFSLEIINNSNDEKQRNKYLHAIKQDVRELDMLIDEMLSYAKLGAHNLKLNRQSVNAEHWLKEIIQHYNAEKIAINLHCSIHLSDAEKQILIDKHLMSRAVHNLIRNGLRYAHKQLQISFIRERNQVSLRIEDDGEGIPRQFWEQVFQPFTRLDTSRDKQSGGYGLGLAITQKIVHQHGGRIQIDKSALGGVCFKINWTI